MLDFKSENPVQIHPQFCSLSPLCELAMFGNGEEYGAFYRL